MSRFYTTDQYLATAPELQAQRCALTLELQAYSAPRVLEIECKPRQQQTWDRMLRWTNKVSASLAPALRYDDRGKVQLKLREIKNKAKRIHLTERPWAMLYCAYWFITQARQTCKVYASTNEWRYLEQAAAAMSDWLVVKENPAAVDPGINLFLETVWGAPW